MDELEIKQEIHAEDYCRTCLTVGRKLSPLRRYKDLFRELFSEFIYRDNNIDKHICWECEAVLRKVQHFQRKVARADAILKNGQQHIYGTLSNLTTVTLNDLNPQKIYINETQLVNDSRTEINDSRKDTNDSRNKINNLTEIDSIKDSESNFDNKSANVDNENNVDKQIKIEIDAFDDFHETSDFTLSNENEYSINENGPFNNNENVENEMVDVKVETELENAKKKKYPNKWSMKRRALNKKPKYKIVSSKDLDVETIFYKPKGSKIDDLLMKEKDKYSDCEFKCFECITGFSSKDKFEKHKKWHIETKKVYKCDVCDTLFNKKGKISEHMRKHYDSYKCLLCDKIFGKNERIVHLNECHKKVLQCLKCDMKFNTHKKFDTHFKALHMKFICDYCGVCFKLRYCLKDHIRKKHSLECKECKMQFSRYNSLWLHNKLKHTISHDAYCVECDKVFSNEVRYRWHIANSKKHTPKKKEQVPCPQCDRIFSKKIYMTDHLNLFHLKVFKYTCSHCEKHFKRNADLVRHKQKVHEGVPLPRNKICNICGKGFTTNNILNHHILTHTGEKPHACAQCGARFIQKSALNGHVKALHRKKDDC